MEELKKLNSKMMDNLSFEDFVKTLEYVNLKLRGKTYPDEETGIYQGDMIVEGLVSPSNEMQMIILKRLYNSLKEEISAEAKGMICYYTLNNLHLFKDGNGRTSRYFYQLYNNKFDEEYLFHPDSKEDQSKRTKFEKENGISRVEYFLNDVNYNIFLNKLDDGSIYDCERMREYTRISTHISELFVDQHFDTPFLSDVVVSQLGKYAKEFARNISNRNCQISLSGIAMCELLTKRNVIQHFIELNDEHFKEVSEKFKIDIKGNLLFYVGSNGEFKADVNTESWDLETCLEYIKISEKLLLEQFEMIVEASKYYSNIKQQNNEQVDTVNSVKETYIEMNSESEINTSQIRNEYQTMMDTVNSSPSVDELEKVREEYIKMMSGDDINYTSMSNEDSDYSDHMTLPTQSNEMHRR